MEKTPMKFANIGRGLIACGIPMELILGPIFKWTATPTFGTDSIHPGIGGFPAWFPGNTGVLPDLRFPEFQGW